MPNTKKQVLIDLTMLKRPYCGLGQIAINYCKLLKQMDLSALNFEITLLVPRGWKGAAGEQVHYRVANHLNRWFQRIAFKHYDVWHSTYQLSHYIGKDIGAAQTILTMHDLNYIYEHQEPTLQQKFLRKMQRKINAASYITCISNFVREDLMRHLTISDKPLEVIYNGVEFIPSDIEGTMPNTVPPDKPFFFAIGEVKQKKNLLPIVRMMAHLPKVMLYIAGRDNTAYATELRRYIADNNLTNVRLLGPVSESERIWLYRHARALLFPSLFEGFGLPVIEAMSCGLPVFCTRSTSVPEIGGDYAYYWEDMSPEPMAKFVTSHLTEYESTTERRQAAIQYAHTFSYPNHMNAYLRLYDRLCHI